MNELAVLKSVNFDWTLHLRNIWSDSVPHVPELHREIRQEILESLDDLALSEEWSPPLGKVIYGIPGSGKTHLLGSIRKETFQKKQWFILIDMTDVRDFEETVLLGFIDSLQRKYPDGRFQYEVVLERFLEQGGLPPTTLQRLAGLSEPSLIQLTTQIIHRMRSKLPSDFQQYQDVFRSLIYFHSKNATLTDVGYSYLFSFNSEEDHYQKFAFLRNPSHYIDIIRALSWILSVGGVTVLALDQLDAIVTQHHLASGNREETILNDEQKKSLSIIEGIARGLSALRDRTYRTLIVLTCLPPTWEILTKKALASHSDRFEKPLALKDVPISSLAEGIVQQRLARSFEKHQFTPRYPTWPFKASAFQSLVGRTPRDILKACEQYRRDMVRSGNIIEIEKFDGNEPPPPPPPPNGEFKEIDQAFESLKNEVPKQNWFDENEEDNQLGTLLQNGYRFLLLEWKTPDSIDVLLDCDFPSGKQYPPLHARIRVVHRTENDREEHYCIRALLRTNASSYRARLKVAMAASGIDRDLSFRCLRLIRNTDVPSGSVTQQLTQEFFNHQGKFIKPSLDDLQTISVLIKMQEKYSTDFFSWLESRTPVSRISLFEDAMTWLKSKLPEVSEVSEVPEVPEPPRDTGKETTSSKTKTNTDDSKTTIVDIGDYPPPLKEKRIPIGNRLIGSQVQEEIQLDLLSMTKHTVILAGSGSGKTVLIKRLIEEAALAGIPSIVIDAANDLSRLGQAWPQPPSSWREGDAQKAERYFRETETIIWTPGREKGNPLYLSPLPDFSLIKNDSDELLQAIFQTRDSFQEIIAPGSSSTAQIKLGIFVEALRYFAQHTCGTLDDFIELLADLPPEAGGKITNSAKSAQGMANLLRAAQATNPLLNSTHQSLDPAILLHSPSKKTRISIMNFIGLPGLKSQQEFINQLAMTLFTWIKKNPASPESPLQGLLVIDEAKDFIPSGRSTPCKQSLNRLAAQARKYGLGLIFATQLPKSIDHSVIANCMTHFYGQINSPESINTIQDLLKQKGSSASDISKLGTGNFYMYSDKINGEISKSTIKIKTPICLSYHPNSPMDENAVLECAQQSRQLFNTEN